MVIKPVMPPQVKWLVSLMTSLLLFNYIDRGNLATVGPVLTQSQHLTAADFGLLVSAFYFTYAPAQLLVGWLCERVQVEWLLTAGAILWSLTTLATGLVSGLAALLGVRLLLGLGESAIFPASSKLFAAMIPEEALGRANGWMAAGLALGPAVGTWTGSYIVAGFGWRASFVLFGLASLAWLLPWFHYVRRFPPSARVGSAHPPGYGQILRRRAAWGTFLGHFSANYSFYTLISWMPTYLVRARGLSLEQVGIAGGLGFYALLAAASLAAGWFGDRLIANGAGVNIVRKSSIVLGQAGSGACLIACALDPSLALVVLVVSALLFGMASAPLYSIAQTLAGAKAAGQWIGAQNFFGNLAGIISPYVTGVLVEHSGRYDLAFLQAGFISLIGAAAWGLLIPRVETLDWSTNGDARSHQLVRGQA